jgi:hypothetical protein
MIAILVESGGEPDGVRELKSQTLDAQRSRSLQWRQQRAQCAKAGEPGAMREFRIETRQDGQ